MILHSCTYTPGRLRVVRLTFVLIFLSAAFAPVSSAYTYLFATGTGGVPGAVVDADGATVFSEAFITMNAVNQTVTIELLNLQMDPAGIKSVIGAVEVDFGNLAAGTNTSSMNTQATVSTFDIGAGGVISNLLNGQTAAWKTETANSAPTAGYASNTVALCDICQDLTNAPGGPAFMNIGGPPSSNAYTGNGSINNGQHSPFILGSGQTYSSGPLAGASSTPTWKLNVPLLQANTTITQVRFYYGSAYSVLDEQVAGVEIAPEPDGIMLMSGGLALVGLGLWKRRARRP